MYSVRKEQTKRDTLPLKPGLQKSLSISWRRPATERERRNVALILQVAEKDDRGIPRDTVGVPEGYRGNTRGILWGYLGETWGVHWGYGGGLPPGDIFGDTQGALLVLGLRRTEACFYPSLDPLGELRGWLLVAQIARAAGTQALQAAR